MNPLANTQLPQGLPTQQGTPLQQILDSNLRANHLPDPISFWPLAAGWWILLAIIILAVSVGIYFILKHRKANAFRRDALQSLEAIPLTPQFPAEANTLLKQVCLSHPNTPEHIAGAAGSTWKDFLIENTNAFDDSKASWLSTVAYQENSAITDIEVQQLKAACKEWIKQYKPNSGNKTGVTEC